MRQLRFALFAASSLVASGAHAQHVGPSTTTAPYVLPNPTLPPGAVQTRSLLTVGDSIGGYRLVGLPDGLGAWSEEAGRLTLVANHELDVGLGAVRAHGTNGAFVSRWTIDTATHQVLTGRDHCVAPSNAHEYDRTSGAWTSGGTPWSRFCSGDLARASAYYFPPYGTRNRIYLCGEETRPPTSPDHGRAFAHVVTGAGRDHTWELPHLGRMSFENAVACPHPQQKTIVVCMDDADFETDPMQALTPSELYVYVGSKTDVGRDIDRAGLTRGLLYGVKVFVNNQNVAAEDDQLGFGGRVGTYVGSARFALKRMGNAAAMTGNELQAAAIGDPGTLDDDLMRFQRVEDGAWDVRAGHRGDYYFVTPAALGAHSRLMRLRFADIAQPEQGGTISILLDGVEGHQSLDNLCADPLGRLVLLEDPGSDPRLAKVWLYDTNTGLLREIAAHAPQFFSGAGASFLTINEEASGVISAFDLIGPGWYVLDVQAHYTIGGGELVEGGQLLELYVDPAF